MEIQENEMNSERGKDEGRMNGGEVSYDGLEGHGY